MKTKVFATLLCGLAWSETAVAQTVDMPATDLPGNVAYSDEGFVIKRDFIVPKDLWLHGYRIEIIDAAGNAVPTNVLHHISMVSPDYRELFSPLMLRVAAAGAETGEVRVPRWVGMPLKRGSRLNLDAMLHNPSAVEYKGVTVRVHLYTTSQRWNPDAAVAFPFHVHATAPTASWEFDVPPGESVHSWEGKPTRSGKLVGLGGHLHQYGVSVSLYDVTEGRMLFEGQSQRDSTGDVRSITRSRFTPKSVRIDASHTYRISSVYNNPTDCTIVNGGMGIIAGLLIPNKRSEWPVADPSNPVFIADQTSRFTSREQSQQHHAQHQ